MEKNILLGVGITNETKEDILKYIITSLEKKGETYYIVTPNPEFLVHSVKNPRFAAILNNARLALPDGIGVIIAAKILGRALKERITGVDLMENICKEVSRKPITVGFLGGRDRVAERTAECLRSKYPGLKVSFVGQEWGEEGIINADYNSKLQFKSKNQLYAPIDLLFVAYGFPKQEAFMAEHLGKIPVRVMMGVGGSFDYISGRVSRAPLPIRLIGFEWLYRLIRQPVRWRRQVALLEFIVLVLRERFR